VDLPKATKPVSRTGWLASVSIEYKLPLLFGGLLLAVILAVSAIADVEMRRTVMHAASERSSSLTKQFGALMQQSGAQLRAPAALMAAKPEIAAFIKSTDARSRAAALEVLVPRGPQTEQIVANELRDSADAIVLSATSDTISGATLTKAERLATPTPDVATIGGFRRIGTLGAYPVTVPVPGATGYHVVQWRRITGSREGREGLKSLIGSDATLYLGNRDGSYVTDLEREISGLTLSPASFNAPQVELRPNGEGGDSRRLVSWAAVPNTKWAVGVEFPLAVILAPVNAYMQRIALLAFAALLVALFAAWVMSRRLTTPLSQLAAAAEAMSNGDYSQRLHIARSDELGRLGRGFNIMAAEVAQSRDGLEKMVEERTRDLNATLQQLNDAQESLVRREKLAMLGQLASGVGHELRNPLGVMTNAVYYLKAVLPSASASVTEYLGILQQQITLSEKIVSDLLDFARLKPPTRFAASFEDITREQITRLGSTNGVTIDTNFPSDLPPVLVDSVQIGQIMLNLLTNAMQAMDHTGRITVNARAEDSIVWCDVRDTGPGVAPENVGKIFEPLFTTKARGIGLGLAVSRTLARANEGDLTLADSLEPGAVFRLTLPASRAG
jgi:signal transduction histidine kinase